MTRGGVRLYDVKLLALHPKNVGREFRPRFTNLKLTPNSIRASDTFAGQGRMERRRHWWYSACTSDRLP